MLRILSDLTITSRVDIAPKTGETYYQGSWVLADGSANFTRLKVPMGCVFNMEDSSGVLSKDTKTIAVDSTQKASVGGSETVTLITGPFRGVTDKINDSWNGGTSVGDPLTVISGVLAKATLGTDHVVALLEAKLTNFEHRGATYTAWRFKTV